MKQLQVTNAAHAAAKAAAESAGTSMVAWASERLTTRYEDLVRATAGVAIPAGTPVCLDERLPDDVFIRITRMASARSQSPAETLSAALDALERPAGAAVPDPHRAPWERK